LHIRLDVRIDRIEAFGDQRAAGGEQGAQLLELVRPARLQVDLGDGIFERVDGLVQVGVLRIEEGLALARLGQFVQRGQVDRAQRVDLALDAVDLALQAPELDAAFFDVISLRSITLSLADRVSKLTRPTFSDTSPLNPSHEASSEAQEPATNSLSISEG
jgi:hypothetical protein